MWGGGRVFEDVVSGPGTRFLRDSPARYPCNHDRYTQAVPGPDSPARHPWDHKDVVNGSGTRLLHGSPVRYPWDHDRCTQVVPGPGSSGTSLRGTPGTTTGTPE